MENENGAVITLIILVVFAFLLLVAKFTEFIVRFNQETKYIVMEINRASDHNEYRYWRRELRCHYLCLIPFVTERNVPKIYHFLFHRPNHAKKENRSDGIFHILAPSLIGICLCAVFLCGASWAWFTAGTTTGTTEIQSSYYKLLYQVNEDTDTTELAEAGTSYTLTANGCVIKLKATGTAGATGYFSIKVGNETYYTEQIFVDDTFIFTVNASAGTNIILTPKWGTYSHTATIQDKGEIAATGSQQSNIQEPNNIAITEPTAPTAPTTLTTPSSSPAESETTTPEPSVPAPAPAESETTTPEPSATAPAPAESETTTPEPSATAPAPTQPESTTDTEQTPASKETTADPTEPLTTEEIKSN